MSSSEPANDDKDTVRRLLAELSKESKDTASTPVSNLDTVKAMFASLSPDDKASVLQQSNTAEPETPGQHWAAHHETVAPSDSAIGTLMTGRGQADYAARKDKTLLTEELKQTLPLPMEPTGIYHRRFAWVVETLLSILLATPFRIAFQGAISELGWNNTVLVLLPGFWSHFDKFASRNGLTAYVATWFDCVFAKLPDVFQRTLNFLITGTNAAPTQSQKTMTKISSALITLGLSTRDIPATDRGIQTRNHHINALVSAVVTALTKDDLQESLSAIIDLAQSVLDCMDLGFLKSAASVGTLTQTLLTQLGSLVHDTRKALQGDTKSSVLTLLHLDSENTSPAQLRIAANNVIKAATPFLTTSVKTLLLQPQNKEPPTPAKKKVGGIHAPSAPPSSAARGKLTRWLRQGGGFSADKTDDGAEFSFNMDIFANSHSPGASMAVALQQALEMFGVDTTNVTFKDNTPRPTRVTAPASAPSAPKTSASLRQTGTRFPRESKGRGTRTQPKPTSGSPPPASATSYADACTAGACADEQAHSHDTA